MPTRAPIIMPRMDGMSADGLSYSVANDYGKQMGQALANYEARTRDPRYIPGALVEHPDSPELLRQELLDPVQQAWGMNQTFPGQTPTARVVGHSLVEYDPRNRGTKVLYSDPTAPKAIKPPPELTKRQINDLDLITYEIKQKQKAQAAALTTELKQGLSDELAALDLKRQAIFNGPTGTNAPAVQIPTGLSRRQPTGFIGSPGGTNQFQAPIVPSAAPAAQSYNPVRGDVQMADNEAPAPEAVAAPTNLAPPGRSSPFTPWGVIQQTSPATNASHVVRFVDGKPAIFDSKTKKFIKWQ